MLHCLCYVLWSSLLALVALRAVNFPLYKRVCRTLQLFQGFRVIPPRGNTNLLQFDVPLARGGRTLRGGVMKERKGHHEGEKVNPRVHV